MSALGEGKVSASLRLQRKKSKSMGPAALFFFWPLAELVTFLQICAWIGTGWALLGIVGSALLGASLIRRQGLAVLQRFHAQQQSQADPTQDPLTEVGISVTRMVAGLLLIVPGYLTDGLALALLLPGLGDGVAARLAGWAKRRFQIQMTVKSGAHSRSGAAWSGRSAGEASTRSTIIDGDYQDVTPPPATPRLPPP